MESSKVHSVANESKIVVSIQKSMPRSMKSTGIGLMRSLAGVIGRRAGSSAAASSYLSPVRDDLDPVRPGGDFKLPESGIALVQFSLDAYY